MNKFICVVGLPASGKSTLAQNLSKEYNTEIISSDQLRIELFNNVDDQEHNNELFTEIHKRIKDNLKNGKNIVFDACNISWKKRRQTLEDLKKIDCEKICYLMATPYEDCLKQNKKRDRVVPEYVIKKMYLQFFVPMYQEGWDNIKIEWNYNPKDFDEYELFQGKNGLIHISQDNPHHTLTIGNHCLKCMENIEDMRIDNPILKEAALYHDIGKKFTKQFKNCKGEISDIAHYYNHNNVSAYNILFYEKANDYSDKFILSVSEFAQFHMQPFFLPTEKSKKRFINFVGQEFYDNLLLLHNADINAK